MRIFEYNFKNYDGEEKTLNLRLVSSDMKTIEKKTGVKLLDYVSDYSITAITTLLMYMNRPVKTNYSMAEAEELYDELIDSGLSLEQIYTDIIMETLVISGVMTKQDLDGFKEVSEKNKEARLEEIKNPNKK